MAGGLPPVEQRFGIEPLAPDASGLLIEQTLGELKRTDPTRRYLGVTYNLSKGNRLPGHWLLQTPDAWGMAAAQVPFLPVDCQNCDPDFRLPACVAGCDCEPVAATVNQPGLRPRNLCVGQSDAFVDVFYRLVVSAHRIVDITLLQPPPDDRFLAALRNAITWLAYSGRRVTVRVMIGSYPPDGVDAAGFMHELLRDAVNAPRDRLQVFVGAMRSCDGGKNCGSLSWNHAKIVAVDGERAIVGGHNMWTKDYLAAAPVHDLSMEIDGPAAAAADRFADALWGFLCRAPRQDRVNASYSYEAHEHEFGTECLDKSNVPHNAGNERGGIPVLSIGRLASGITTDFADQSLVARDLVLGAATKTIRMVQQDVAFASPPLPDVTWPDNVLEKLASLLVDKHGEVYLVLSNFGAAGPTGTYSNGVRLGIVADKIRDAARDLSRWTEPELNALLCRQLHIAPLRFGPDATWPDNKPIGLHAKFWMVDERAFYIGPENLYPSELQEFGYVVEDHAAAAQVLHDYWDKVWRWSAPAQISGGGTQACVFTSSVTKKP